MKKLTVIILILCCALTLLSGCGTADKKSGSDPSATTENENQTVPGAYGSPISADDLKVGIILADDPLTNRSSATQLDTLSFAADYLAVSREQIYEAHGEFADRKSVV